MNTSMSQKWKNQYGAEKVSTGIPASGPEYMTTSVDKSVFNTAGMGRPATKNEPSGVSKR